MRDNDQRPVFLSLHKIRLPLNGLVSIFHRISGLVMFLTFPVLLCALSCSLKSPEHFVQIQSALSQPKGWGLILYLMMLAWTYHAIAGLRHLIMDCGWGESLCVSRMSAKAVLGVFMLSAVCLGGWIW